MIVVDVQLNEDGFRDGGYFEVRRGEDGKVFAVHVMPPEPSDEAKEFAADPGAWVRQSLHTLVNLPKNFR